jgi:hypothetical protein
MDLYRYYLTIADGRRDVTALGPGVETQPQARAVGRASELLKTAGLVVNRGGTWLLTTPDPVPFDIEYWRWVWENPFVDDLEEPWEPWALHRLYRATPGLVISPRNRPESTA